MKTKFIKKLFLCTLTILFAVSCKTSQIPGPKEISQKLGKSPYYEFNGVETQMSELRNVSSDSIATIETFFDEDAVDRYGEKARDGAVLIITKDRAREMYIAFFSKRSEKYASLIEEVGDTNIQYILNDKVKTNDFEGSLSMITDKEFKRLKIISKEVLQKKYGVSDKQYGVVIKARAPKTLYRGKEKF